MEGEDGEILRFDRVDGGVEMFVSWTRYQPVRQIYRDYRIACAAALWSDTGVTPASPEAAP